MGKTPSPTPNEFAFQFIKSKAEQLCRKPGFTSSDVEDLKQELLTDLVQRLPGYNPRRGSLNTFVVHVVERKAVSILRYRFAQKRTPARSRRLTPDSPSAARDPAFAQAERGSCDLNIDIADIRRDKLSEAQRLIAEVLTAGGTRNSAARELGMSRREVNRHMDEIMWIFEDAGMREYP